MLLSDAVPVFAKGTTFIVPYTTPERQEEQVAKLKELASLHPGKSRLNLWIETESGAYVVVNAGPAFNVTPDFNLIGDVESLLGAHSVRLEAKDDIYNEYVPRHRKSW